MHFRIAIAALATLVVAAATPAGAARIEFVWQATGTDSITVMPGEDVVLEGRVVTEGDDVIGVAVSALAPVSLLDATGFSVCPSGCGSLGPAGLANVILNDQSGLPGLSGSFAALSLSVQQVDFVLFELTYRVVGLGSGEVLSYYREGVDGLADRDTGFYIPPVVGADLSSAISLTVIPEPSTAALLALGLAGFAARGRSGRVLGE